MYVVNYEEIGHHMGVAEDLITPKAWQGQQPPTMSDLRTAALLSIARSLVASNEIQLARLKADR